MERSKVTFENEDGKTIVLNFEYNRETSSVSCVPELDERYGKDEPLDFNGFLADMLLKCLQSDEVAE